MSTWLTWSLPDISRGIMQMIVFQDFFYALTAKSVLDNLLSIKYIKIFNNLFNISKKYILLKHYCKPSSIWLSLSKYKYIQCTSNGCLHHNYGSPVEVSSDSNDIHTKSFFLFLVVAKYSGWRMKKSTPCFYCRFGKTSFFYV